MSYPNRRLGNAQHKAKNLLYALHFARLALSLNKIGGGSEMHNIKQKICFMLCISLALHYLCTKKHRYLYDYD